MRTSTAIYLLLITLCLDVQRSCAHPHHDFVRVPTISPFPTESPAPSPSPSEFPTDTQAPSESLRPSDLPSDYPSFVPSEQPSENPTLFPTESPAPSPSPSETPTLRPSEGPSVSVSPSSSQQPSFSPTTGAPSDYPTMAPTAEPSSAPSANPTISPAPTITAQPTGFVFLVAQDVQIMFQGVTSIMEASHIEFFQEETKLFLQRNVHQAPGVFDIEVQAVTVTSQKLVGARRLGAESTNLQSRHLQQENTVQNPQALVVNMQVVALALLDPSEHFDLNIFLDIFFENYDNLYTLRLTLEQEESFSNDIFWQEHSLEGSGNRSMAGSIAGAFFGVAVSFIGFSGIMMWWIRKRRTIRSEEDEKEPDELHQMTFSHSYDTDDCLPEDTSPPKQFVVDSKTLEAKTLSSNCKEQKQQHKQQQQQQQQQVVVEVMVESEDEDSMEDVEAQSEKGASLASAIQPPHLMYTPALMTTESNIEVPDTPVTAFTAQGARSTFTTPLGAGMSKSGNDFDAKPILDASSKTPPLPSTSMSQSEKAVCAPPEAETKRKHLLPHVWKSPFRRDVPKYDVDDDSVCDSDTGSDVVVPPVPGGGFPPRQRNDNKHKKKTKRQSKGKDSTSFQPPSLIGGPETVPSLVNSMVSKEDTVGIVDEVTYLYSTTGEKKKKKKKTN